MDIQQQLDNKINFSKEEPDFLPNSYHVFKENWDIQNGLNLTNSFMTLILSILIMGWAIYNLKQIYSIQASGQQKLQMLKCVNFNIILTVFANAIYNLFDIIGYLMIQHDSNKYKDFETKECSYCGPFQQFITGAEILEVFFQSVLFVIVSKVWFCIICAQREKQKVKKIVRIIHSCILVTFYIGLVLQFYYLFSKQKNMPDNKDEHKNFQIKAFNRYFVVYQISISIICFSFSLFSLSIALPKLYKFDKSQIKKLRIGVYLSILCCILRIIFNIILSIAPYDNLPQDYEQYKFLWDIAFFSISFGIIVPISFVALIFSPKINSQKQNFSNCDLEETFNQIDDQKFMSEYTIDNTQDDF